MAQLNPAQEPRSGANDPFDILDPATVAAQEKYAQQAALEQQWMARAQMDPRAKVSYNLQSGVGNLLTGLADKLTPQGDSPAVAKAKVLQQVLSEAQGIRDPIAQREFMAKRMLELGQNQEAGKFQEQVLKMRKANSDNAKTDAETVDIGAKPEREFRTKFLGDGYSASQVDAAMALRKAGAANWMEPLKDKHSDETWSEVRTYLLKSPDGKSDKNIAYIEALTGPNKGKKVQLNSATEVNVSATGGNASASPTIMSPAQGSFEGIKTWLDVESKVQKDLEPITRQEQALRQGYSVIAELQKNPNNSTASAALVKNLNNIIVQMGESSKDERNAVAGAGSLYNSGLQLMKNITGGGLTATKLAEATNLMNAMAASLKKYKEQKVNAAAGTAKSLGVSSDVLGNFYDTNGLPRPAADPQKPTSPVLGTTDAARPALQAPVSMGGQASRRNAEAVPSAPPIPLKETTKPGGPRTFNH